MSDVRFDLLTTVNKNLYTDNGDSDSMLRRLSKTSMRFSDKKENNSCLFLSPTFRPVKMVHKLISRFICTVLSIGEKAESRVRNGE